MASETRSTGATNEAAQMVKHVGRDDQESQKMKVAANFTLAANIMHSHAASQKSLYTYVYMLLHSRRRMLASLDNVLASRESPLEIKEPMALKFLPHSLLEELRIVKMSQKLGMHPLLHMLMDDAGRQTVVSGA